MSTAARAGRGGQAEPALANGTAAAHRPRASSAGQGAWRHPARTKLGVFVAGRSLPRLTHRRPVLRVPLGCRAGVYSPISSSG